MRLIALSVKDMLTYLVLRLAMAGRGRPTIHPMKDGATNHLRRPALDWMDSRTRMTLNHPMSLLADPAQLPGS